MFKTNRLIFFVRGFIIGVGTRQKFDELSLQGIMRESRTDMLSLIIINSNYGRRERAQGSWYDSY
jgi:hypothetical protein